MQFIKKLIPRALLKAIRPMYHGFLAWLGSVYFRHPSKKLIVIGVTGTNGKSTTVNLIAQVLTEAGFRVGFTSTVNFKISDTEELNNLKMTMPSGWTLQKWMADMVKQGFQYAVLEISSEGLAQNRHRGIHFDVAVFTNLTPEHLDSHGGFENYKQAKARLFQALMKYPIAPAKLIIQPSLKRTNIVNADDENSGFYGGFPADVHLTFGVTHTADVYAPGLKNTLQGIEFDVGNVHLHLQLKGKFDVYNALAALAVGVSQNIPLASAAKALEKVPGIPGRMEVIQEKPFMVLVDYAPEPYSLKALYETLDTWPKHRLIHLLGSAGGGRDTARRKVLGRMAGETADIVIVTNEDPYDDNPQDIIHEVADGAVSVGKVIGQTLFRNPDRRAAIAKAFSLAVPGDLVLLTGKGAEQKMAVANGKYIDWDDRKVARDELKFKEINDKKTQTSQTHS